MPASIFNGASVKILKDILKFKTGTLIVTGESSDPTSVAFDAPQNSIYIQSGTSNIYKKLDAGLSTNWQLIGNMNGAASSTDNAVARFDGVTGKLIQNSAVTIDDSGNIATSGTVDGRDVSTDGTTLDTHLNGGASKHDANEVDYERTDGSKKNIQAASDDLEAATSDLDDAIGALPSTPSNYSPANAAIVASHLVAIDTAIGDAISTINMLEFQDSVLSATILTPPGSPSTGDRYLINGIGLAGWTGFDNNIVEYNGSSWDTVAPTTGMFVASDAEADKLYYYGGASWTAKNFEATTASGFLSKAGFDIQLNNLDSQNVIVGSGSNVATSVNTASVGDISASTTGGFEIKAGVIVDADINNSAAISQSKLNLSITDAEVNASAAISQSKLNLSITDAEVNVSAAIARTKIANGTADHVVINNGSGTLTSEATLAKVRGGSGQDNTNITFPATGTLATLAGTEQLTNKDIDGATASDTSRITLPKASTSTLDALTRKEGTIVYDTTLDEPLFDDGNDLKPFGINSSSPVNYFSDYSCLNILKVLTYDNSAAVPTDGTGGTVDYVSVTSETTTPLTGTKSYKLSKSDNDAQGEGFAILTDRTLDNTVKNGAPVLIQFKYQTSANYASGDIKVFVYRVGSNTLEALNGVDGLGAFGNSLNADQTGRGQFSGYINCSSSDTAIRLIFHAATTNASAYDLVVDNVFMGTASQLVSSVDSDWEQYPAILTGFGTPTNVDLRYMRQGPTLHIKGRFTSGTPTAVVASVSLPNNLVANTGSIGGGIFGRAIRSAGASSYVKDIALIVSSGGSIFKFGSPEYSLSVDPADDMLATAFAGSGQTFFINLEVPIQDWSAGNTISSTQANFQSVKVFGRNNGGTSLTADTTDIDFTEEQDLHGLWSGTQFTAVATSDYSFNGNIRFNAAYSGSINAFVNGVNTQFAGAGNGFQSVPVNGIIRLTKGQVFSLRPDTNSTLAASGVHQLSIKQLPDLTVVGISGAPYERISASITSVTATTLADTRTDVTGGSIVIPPGKWKIGYNINTRIQKIGSAGGAYGRVNIADPSGNIMSQTCTMVGADNLASSESMYTAASAYQIVDTTTGGTYKVQITCSAAAAAGIMHAIADTYGFFTGTDASSEIYAERIK